MSRPLVERCSLNSLVGVGAAQRSSKLAKIGLHTVQDTHNIPPPFPALRRPYPSLPHWRTAARHLRATVEGEVLGNITFGGRRMMTCQISDGCKTTPCAFNFNAAMKNSTATGRRVLAYGEAKRGKYGARMIHRNIACAGRLNTPELQETLTPSIRPPGREAKATLRRKLTDPGAGLLDTCAIAELLPPELARGMIMSLPEALRTLHRPPPTLQLADLETGKHPAQRQRCEELLARQPPVCWRFARRRAAPTTLAKYQQHIPKTSCWRRCRLNPPARRRGWWQNRT